MAVIIPQVVTEDRANEARAIDGSLKFNSANSHYLNRTPASAGNRRTFTVSFWIKRTVISSAVTEYLFEGGSPDGYSTRLAFRFLTSDAFSVVTGTIGYRVTTQVFRDPSAWYHFVVAFDTTNATAGNRIKIYVNGSEIQSFSTSNNPSQNDDTGWNMAAAHSIGRSHIDSMYGNFYLADFYNIDGQALDPSYFGFTDPLTNTWRPKKYTGTYGTNGFYLPMDGNSPIGEDKSGRGNNWTPVNFGGSNTLEKATGALPILNTDGGGKVARVGVRTDATVAAGVGTCILALPLVGVKSDFSYRVDGRSTEKVITANGNAGASSAQSNFYGGSFVFDGTGDYLSLSSSDFAVGTSDFTVEAWIYQTGGSGGAGGIFSTTLVDSSIGINLSQDRAWIGNNGSQYYDCNPGADPFYTLNTWHHIAYVKFGTNGYLFLDGILKASATGQTPQNIANTSATVGRRYAATDNYYFNGYIQDLRFYKGTAKYTQNFIPASTDPDILPDTPSGVSYSSSLALSPSTEGAVAFDGGGDWLSLPTSADFSCSSGTNFTFEAFIYPTSVSDTTPFGIGNNAGFAYRIISGSPYLYVAATGGILNTGTIVANKWTHIAITRNSGTLYSFIDGVLVGSVANSGSFDGTQQNFVGAANLTGAGSPGYTFTGQISNAHWVNGTALYTSNFTPPTAPITSVANTKLLCCKSQTSATASDVTPGTITANGNAVAINFNPFTVNINTVRGQESSYATLNPLVYGGANDSNIPLSNGNLNMGSSSDGPTGSSGNDYTKFATVGVSTGKWYFETYKLNTTSNCQVPSWITVNCVSGDNQSSLASGKECFGFLYSSSGAYNFGVRQNNTTTTFGSAISGQSQGDVHGLAIDLNNNQLTGYKNGVSLGTTTFSTPSQPVTPGLTQSSSWNYPGFSFNFGQKPFKFPPPAGFQPLALANTPRPTIVRPGQYVDTIIWSGTGGGSGATRSLTGLGFKPDFVWQKARSSGTSHRLLDSVRGSGTGKTLSTNNTNAEGNGGSDESLYGYLSSFDRDGFTLTNGTSTFDNGNKSGDTYVAWAWKAGGNSNTYNINDIGYSTASAAGLTAGTITPTGASVNTKSGFSIIGYTGNGVSNATVSHGLGAIPSFAIVKSRSSNSWFIRHNSLDSDKNLNFTSGGMVSPDGSGIVGNLTSSTTFTLKNGSNNTDNINANGTTYIAYIWAEIPGFSKFGSYVGNGSTTDGPMIVTGFRPRWILVKWYKDVSTAESWMIYDTARSPYNAANTVVYPDSSTTEESPADRYIDILSNGFKPRQNGQQMNRSGASYIFAAFAESPQFNLYGGQSNAR